MRLLQLSMTLFGVFGVVLLKTSKIEVGVIISAIDDSPTLVFIHDS